MAQPQTAGITAILVNASYARVDASTLAPGIVFVYVRVVVFVRHVSLIRCTLSGGLMRSTRFALPVIPAERIVVIPGKGVSPRPGTQESRTRCCTCGP